MAGVAVTGLSKSYGAATVLHPLDLSIEDGEFVVIVGPSGCGKSTLLRLIAGLDEPSGGRVVIGGVDVTTRAPATRGVAMVFQSYALYPHLTVRENIAFPLKVAKRPTAEIAARVAEVADMLDLTTLLDRRPRALSGGQRQRVSIGRAVVRRPQVLLLDEPLSNLDTALRVRMRHAFARLHQQLGTTMIYVTHDQLEAMTLANRIVVMSEGRVEQVGAPLDLYEQPATLAVAQAIGSPSMNLLPVRAVGDHEVELTGGRRVRVAVTPPRGDALILGVRPEHLVLDPDGPFCGSVELFERLGPLSFAHLATPAGVIVAQLPGHRSVTLGEELCFTVPADQASVFSDGARVGAIGA
jgi:ABC-type sugar transport system ATPase subunit